MLGDGIAWIFISKHNCALNGGEIGFAINHQNVEGAELLIVELLNLVAGFHCEPS